MELGELSQLEVYEFAVRNSAMCGNPEGVELFGRLICEIAGSKMDTLLTEYDHIICGDNLDIFDLVRGPEVRQGIVEANSFLEKYCPESQTFRDYLYQAKANSQY